VESAGAIALPDLVWVKGSLCQVGPCVPMRKRVNGVSATLLQRNDGAFSARPSRRSSDVIHLTGTTASLPRTYSVGVRRDRRPETAKEFE
jgi:hypothetical protein